MRALAFINEKTRNGGEAGTRQSRRAALRRSERIRMPTIGFHQTLTAPGGLGEVVRFAGGKLTGGGAGPTGPFVSFLGLLGVWAPDGEFQAA